MYYYLITIIHINEWWVILCNHVSVIGVYGFMLHHVSGYPAHMHGFILMT